MKKAVFILCVLIVLALLCVPVLAEVLSNNPALYHQMAPAPYRGTGQGAEAPDPAQLAGYWREPAPRA